MMSKEVGVPKKQTKYPEKIQFSKSVVRMFSEISQRHQTEFTAALIEVYADLNLLDRVKNQQATGETFRLESGFTGITILHPAKMREEELARIEEKREVKNKDDKKETNS